MKSDTKKYVKIGVTVFLLFPGNVLLETFCKNSKGCV